MTSTTKMTLEQPRDDDDEEEASDEDGLGSTADLSFEELERTFEQDELQRSEPTTSLLEQTPSGIGGSASGSVRGEMAASTQIKKRATGSRQNFDEDSDAEVMEEVGEDELDDGGGGLSRDDTMSSTTFSMSGGSLSLTTADQKTSRNGGRAGQMSRGATIEYESSIEEEEDDGRTTSTNDEERRQLNNVMSSQSTEEFGTTKTLRRSCSSSFTSNNVVVERQNSSPTGRSLTTGVQRKRIYDVSVKKRVSEFEQKISSAATDDCVDYRKMNGQQQQRRSRDGEVSSNGSRSTLSASASWGDIPRRLANGGGGLSLDLFSTSHVDYEDNKIEDRQSGDSKANDVANCAGESTGEVEQPVNHVVSTSTAGRQSNTWSEDEEKNNLMCLLDSQRAVETTHSNTQMARRYEQQLELVRDSPLEEMENVSVSVKCEISTILNRFSIKALSDLVVQTNEELLHANLERLYELRDELEKTYKVQLQSIHNHYKELVVSLQTKLAEKEQHFHIELTQFQIDYEKRLRDLEKKHEEEVNRLRLEYSAKVELKVAERERELRRRLHQLEEEHELQVRDIERQHVDHVRELNADHAATLERCLIEASQLLESRVLQVETEHVQCVGQLERQQHDVNETEELRSQLVGQYVSEIIRTAVQTVQKTSTLSTVEQQQQPSTIFAYNCCYSPLCTRSTTSRLHKAGSSCYSPTCFKADRRHQQQDLTHKRSRIGIESDHSSPLLQRLRSSASRGLPRRLSDRRSCSPSADIETGSGTASSASAAAAAAAGSRVDWPVFQSDARLQELMDELGQVLNAGDQDATTLRESIEAMERRMRQLAEEAKRDAEAKAMLEAAEELQRQAEKEAADVSDGGSEADVLDRYERQLAERDELEELRQLLSERDAEIERLTARLDDQQLPSRDDLEMDVEALRVASGKDQTSDSDEQLSPLQATESHSESTHRISERLLKLLNASVRTNLLVDERITEYLQQRDQQQQHGGSVSSSVAAGGAAGMSPGGRWTLHHQRQNHSPSNCNNNNSFNLSELNSSATSLLTDEGLELSRHYTDFYQLSSNSSADVDNETEEVINDVSERLPRSVDRLLTLVHDLERQLETATSSGAGLAASLQERESMTIQLTERREQLEEEINGLKDEMEEWKNRVEELQHALDDSRKELIENQLTEKNKLLPVADEVDAARQQKLVFAENLFEEHQRQDLLERNSLLTTELSELHDRYEVERQQWQSTLSSLEDRVDELQHQLTTSGNASRAAAAEYSRRIETLEAILKSNKTFIEDQATEREQEREEHRKELDKLRNQLQTQEREANSRQRVFREVDDLRDQLDDRRAACDLLMVAKHELETSVKSLQKETIELRNNKARLQLSLEETTIREQQLIQRVKELEAELARQQEINGQLGEEVHQLRGEARQAEELRRILRDLQLELTAAKEADTKQQHRNKELKQRLRAKETELEELQQDRQVLQQRADEQLMQISELRSQLDEMRLQAEDRSAELEIERLTEQLETSRSNAKTAEQQVELLQQQAIVREETIQQVVRKNQETVYEQDHEIRRLQQQVLDQQSTSERLKDDLASVRMVLERALQETESIRRRGAEDVEKLRCELEQRTEEAQRQQEEDGKKINTKNAEVERLTAEVTSLRAELESTLVRHDQLETQWKRDVEETTQQLERKHTEKLQRIVDQKRQELEASEARFELERTESKSREARELAHVTSQLDVHYQSRLDELTSTYEQQMTSLRQSLDSSRVDMDDLERRRVREVGELEEQVGNVTQEMERRLEELMAELEEGRAATIRELQEATKVEIANANATFEAQMEETRAKQELEVERLNGNLKKSRTVMENLARDHEAETEKLRAHYQAQLDEASHIYEERIAELERGLEKSRAEINALLKRHVNEAERLQEHFQAQLDDQTLTYEERNTEMEGRLERGRLEREELEKRHAEEMSQMEAKFREQMENLQKMNEQEVVALTQSLTNSQVEKDRLVHGHEAERSVAEAEHQAQLVEVTQNYERQMVGLRQNLEATRADVDALVRRHVDEMELRTRQCEARLKHDAEQNKQERLADVERTVQECSRELERLQVLADATPVDARTSSAAGQRSPPRQSTNIDELLDDQQTIFDRLQAMLSSLRSEGETLLSLAGNETDRLRTMSSRLVSQEAAVNRVQSSLVDARSRMKQLERDAESAASRLATALEQLEVERRSCAQLLAQRNEDKKAMHDTNERMKTVQRQAESALEAKAALNAKVERLKLELDTERHSSAAVRAELDAARDQLRLAEEYNSQTVAQLQTALDSEITHCNELHVALENECHHSVELQQQLQVERSSRDEALARHEVAVGELASRLDREMQRSGERRETDGDRRHLATVSAELERQQTTCCQLKRDIVRREAEVQSLTEELRRSRDNSSSLQSQLDWFRQHVEELKTDAQRRQLDTERSSGELARTALGRKQLLHLCHRMQMFMIRHQDELTRSTLILRNGSGSGSGVNTEVEKLGRSLTDLLSSMAELQHQLDRDSPEDSRVMASSLAELNIETLRHNSSLTTYSVQLSQDLQSARRTVTKLEEELAHRATRVTDDTTSLRRLSERCVRAESQRDALRYQKRYLLLLIGGFQDGELQALATLSRMGAHPSSGRHRRRPRSRSAAGEGLGRFRVAVTAVMAAYRLRRGINLPAFATTTTTTTTTLPRPSSATSFLSSSSYIPIVPTPSRGPAAAAVSTDPRRPTIVSAGPRRSSSCHRSPSATDLTSNCFKSPVGINGSRGGPALAELTTAGDAVGTGFARRSSSFRGGRPMTPIQLAVTASWDLESAGATRAYDLQRRAITPNPRTFGLSIGGYYGADDDEDLEFRAARLSTAMRPMSVELTRQRRRSIGSLAGSFSSGGDTFQDEYRRHIDNLNDVRAAGGSTTGRKYNSRHVDGLF